MSEPEPQFFRSVSVDQIQAPIMVLILDGNSGISTHVRSHLCYLISLRPLVGSRAVTNRVFFSPPKRSFFFHACTTCAELPSSISTMVPILFPQFTFACRRLLAASSIENLSWNKSSHACKKKNILDTTESKGRKKIMDNLALAPPPPPFSD